MASVGFKVTQGKPLLPNEAGHSQFAFFFFAGDGDLGRGEKPLQ